VDSADTESQQVAPEQEPQRPGPAPRWFQRVLPVTGLVLLVVALTALAVPGFRDQVKLSISRQPQPYVELYFARQTGPVAQAVCTRRGSTVGVRFVIGSHLERTEAVAYRVAVDPVAKGLRTLRKSGTAHTFPKKAVEVRKAFTLPRRGGYTMTVSLPALHQQLRAHCAGQRS
jgi:hypothetical protein